MSRGGLAAIVRALGGDLYAGGRRANVPGPGHSAADRSVSLMLSDGRVIAHSFAGDGWRAVLDDLFERGLVDRDGRFLGAGVAAAASGPSARERRAMAQGLWAEGRPIAGTLSETHLSRRGVGSASAALRHHPGVPAAVYAARGLRRPALLAAITAPAGELTGVEVTYLAPDGERARMALSRKTIGVRAPGSAVRLDPPAPRMLVGEGVATCLSAAAHFGLRAWALLSTGNLRAWRPPTGVRFVVIAADRGRDGERSALILAAALRARGVRGAIRWPPASFGDWNEAWVGSGRGSEAPVGGRGGRVIRAVGPERLP